MPLGNVFTKLFKSEDAQRKERETAMQSVSVPSATEKPLARLLIPWQTEKTGRAQQENHYTFLAPIDMNKRVAADAFRALTGVKPTRVAVGWVYPRSSSGRGKNRRRAKKVRITVGKGVRVNVSSGEKQEKQEK